jgi:hypothetical protein
VTEILDVFDVKLKGFWSDDCHGFLLAKCAAN